ncbi:hypothetical protein A2U01_0056169, partial [Trifolium medium]|nr:hypothetical protein [Trifolium medium]
PSSLDFEGGAAMKADRTTINVGYISIRRFGLWMREVWQLFRFCSRRESYDGNMIFPLAALVTSRMSCHFPRLTKSQLAKQTACSLSEFSLIFHL